ncbi:hypothetical protein TNCT_334571 [Trichonephila clavata]|uniref:Uncharacterized protein n=1 Tax=Trichonephila clavata TaxID=2740835 RepID=A0A8X6G4C7_TRICU|nr:hypothetical protein TNCT_334571 [Trichonephila clavata]
MSKACPMEMDNQKLLDNLYDPGMHILISPLTSKKNNIRICFLPTILDENKVSLELHLSNSISDGNVPLQGLPVQWDVRFGIAGMCSQLEEDQGQRPSVCEGWGTLLVMSAQMGS